MYNKTLICTHGGTFKSRSKGKRARQESRATKCGAKINVCDCVTNKKSDYQVFALCVTRAELPHLYKLDPTTYQYYASVRTSLPARVVDTVDILRKAGAKKKRILELKEREAAGTTSKERMKTWLKEFSEEPGNIGRIFVEKRADRKVETCITLQTKRMREMFFRFAEVMRIDATHGTTPPILQNERAATLMTAIEEFKKPWQFPTARGSIGP
ncbi:hypothetical protein PF004_g4616 [Phytophthora fragariae]|uniref:ZSWIM1/3 RNaseH-like domain-containing protein n=1 Tax=Phytophthora fragariae TaxID=53985 RepID=A0A6G0PI78_9STRA|nr:hypothetical protein PF004_g4616 [Phytophthora fragariae]